MSRESLIKYNNKGFWIPEAFIEVLSEYICKTFEAIGFDTFSLNLKKLYDECNSNRDGENIEIVNISLDRYVSNEIDKTTLINAFDQAKALIRSKGVELSISTLNEFESNKSDDYFKFEWHFPIKTQSLVATIDIIQQLLNGTWESSNYRVYYVGLPNSGGREEI
jgi:hypothetical protein